MQRKRADKGGVYFYIEGNVTATKMYVRSHYDYGHEVENARYIMGNYFLNRNDAKDMLRRIACLFSGIMLD